MLSYLSYATPIARQDITNALEQTFLAEGESIMTTLAEQLKSEGRVEGRVEGERARAVQNILTVLDSRFELPYAVREDLGDVADLAKLDALQTGAFLWQHR
jgi:hypothetical protein